MAICCCPDPRSSVSAGPWTTSITRWRLLTCLPSFTLSSPTVLTLRLISMPLDCPGQLTMEPHVSLEYPQIWHNVDVYTLNRIITWSPYLLTFAWRCSGWRLAVVVINVVGSESLSIVSLITISRTVHLGRSSALTSPLLSQIMLSSQRQLLWFLSLKLDSSCFPNEKQIAWLTLITAAVFGLLSNNQKWEGRGKGLLMAEVRRSRVVFYQSIFITETEKRSRASTRECRGADWFVAASRAQSRRVRREGESTVRSSH